MSCNFTNPVLEYGRSDHGANQGAEIDDFCSFANLLFYSFHWFGIFVFRNCKFLTVIALNQVMSFQFFG